MAQKLHAVLHNFADENDVSSSGEDDCSSVECDIEMDVLCGAVCAHGQREDDPAHEDGGADVDAKRVAVSLLVAEAHDLTMQALKPTTFQKFVHFGFIHPQHTSLMKLFTIISMPKRMMSSRPLRQQYWLLQSHLPLQSLLYNPKRSSFPLLHSSVQTTMHSEEKQSLPKCNFSATVRCLRVLGPFEAPQWHD